MLRSLPSGRSSQRRFRSNVLVSYALGAVGVLVCSTISFAGGQRPATQRLLLDGEKFTALSVTYDGVARGGVAAAQSGVPAAIYRSTGCGFINWIAGQPAWLDQMILFNDGGVGAPLRSYSTEVCYDTCHRGNRCIGGTGAADCDCMSCEDLPLEANLQLYDGDPCGSGIAIAGTQGTVTITAADIPCDQLGDGDSHCFTLTVNVDPKVQIPHDVWIEAQYGIDDAWALVGRPNVDEGQGQSPLSGLNDGVACTTFCDNGGPACTNDADRCDWFLSSADADAQIIFTLQPVPPPSETKWAALSTYTVVGNEAIMPRGGDRVFFDVMVSDFDPDGVNGTLVKLWQSNIDSSGFSSGLRGTLSLPTVGCVQAADCEQQMGIGSLCNEPLFLNRCGPAYINSKRSDSLLFGGAVLTSCLIKPPPHFGCSAILLDGGVASPGRASYLWTLVLDVSSNAKGTFTIPLKIPPSTTLLSLENELLPLVGVIPGKVTIPVGRCCFDLDAAEPGCLDLATRPECNAQPGLSTFQPGGTCETSCTECLPSSAPATEMFGFDVVAKNRYLSIQAGDPGRLQAIRVTAVSLPPPYDVWNGQQWFAGRPMQVCENSGQGAGVPVQECGAAPGFDRRWFWAVPLVCDESLAHYTDWSTMGLVHVVHEGIVPSKLFAEGIGIAFPAIYDIQVIDRNCDASVTANYSDPLSITQAGWGDLVRDCTECPCRVPENQVNIITDATAIIAKFENAPCAVSIARSDLDPKVPDFKIDVIDMLRVNAAFRSIPYPFSPADPEDPCP